VAASSKTHTDGGWRSPASDQIFPAAQLAKC
jgi:hypothetical protein